MTLKAKDKPRFTIIEDPNYNDKYEVHFEDYRREYLDNTKTLDEVNKQFKDIPNCVLHKWGKRIRKEENIFRRNTCRPLTREMQYIQKLAGGRYQIIKMVRGRVVLNCGVYPSLEICKTARDIIWLSNFDESVIEAVKNEYGEDNYIHPSKAYALSKYDEFEEMYENPYLRCNDILTKLNFSGSMYRWCLDEYRRRNPDAPKKRITKTNKNLDEFNKRHSKIYERPLCAFS